MTSGPAHMRGAEEHQHCPMTNHNPTLEDRLSHASEAKKALLAKFKQAIDPENPAAIEKRRQREAIAAARAERIAQREAARQQEEQERARHAALAAEAAAAAARATAEAAAEAKRIEAEKAAHA